MSPGLGAALESLLALRRREALQRGWPSVPEWVFCSETGTALDGGNLSRAWYRLRRRAQTEGVLPLKLHSARHTWATHALQAGKSIRWVADQLGHADPALTLRVYAHAIREDESDVSFADFDAPNGTIRPLVLGNLRGKSSPPDVTARKPWRPRHDSNVRPPV